MSRSTPTQAPPSGSKQSGGICTATPGTPGPIRDQINALYMAFRAKARGLLQLTCGGRTSLEFAVHPDVRFHWCLPLVGHLSADAPLRMAPHRNLQCRHATPNADGTAAVVPPLAQ